MNVTIIDSSHDVSDVINLYISDEIVTSSGTMTLAMVPSDPDYKVNCFSVET